MQEWIADVENTATQRNEARNRDYENVTSRLTEIKESYSTIRVDIIKQQEVVDHFKGIQVDKITEELRNVVQDLASTADFQGEQLKGLEIRLDCAREAKSEVHRLKGDLEAEVSTRMMKHQELQNRLDREVGEFSRRVERLTAATSELGGDLQKSRSTVMMRSGSLTPTSLGSFDRSRLGSVPLLDDSLGLDRRSSGNHDLQGCDS
jgi:chromosome segregation ATPase